MTNNNNRVPITVSLPAWLAEEIRREAAERDMTVSRFVRCCIYTLYFKKSYDKEDLSHGKGNNQEGPRNT